MNYLAHMYLTRDSAQLTLGNFLGDMIRNRELKTLPGKVQEGVSIHRFIDSHTDMHPVVRDHVRLLRPRQGKYAPVAVDVLYDHILAKNWYVYSEKTYTDFCMQVYTVIGTQIHHVPERLIPRARRMLDHGWLEGYDREEHLAFTLDRLNARTNFPSNFHLLINQYKENRMELEEGFAQFFPELITEVEKKVSLQNEKRS